MITCWCSPRDLRGGGSGESMRLTKGAFFIFTFQTLIVRDGMVRCECSAQNKPMFRLPSYVSISCDLDIARNAH